MNAFRLCFSIFIALFTSVNFLTAQDTAQIIIAERQNSPEQQKKPYLIMISIDALRYDMVDSYDAKFLKQKRDEGVQAVSMQPAFPSLTFPNHYTLVTGLYPAHHGLVANTFYAGSDAGRLYTTKNTLATHDGGFYGGVPLWVLAEKQKMLAASFYWVGSEAPIDSTYATYRYNYGEQIPLERRISVVREWLQLPEERRPHFITFYMPQVDQQQHRHGTRSDSVRFAVQFVDHAVKRLNEMTDSLGLPVNYIVVSDHGMMDVDTTDPIRQPSAIDTSKFKIALGATVINLYARDKKDVKKTYRDLQKEEKNFTTYLKTNTPRRWHYRAKDDCYNRLGDIILVANPGKAFNFSARRTSPGEHGYDNRIPQMQASFYAWGPAFKKGMKIPSFSNIHVYPMVARLLGLKLMCEVDGNVDVLRDILSTE